jgi:hypothetical protein
VSAVAIGGRAASIARRHSLSSGKTGLPPAHERVRTGARSADVPPAAASAAAAPVSVNGRVPARTTLELTPEPLSTAPVATAPVATAPRGSGNAAIGGRAVSIERRRALSAGKAALRPAPRNETPPGRAAHSTASPAVTLTPEMAVPPAWLAAAGAGASVREQARERRAERCRCGRGDAAPPAPTRPPRSGTLAYAPKFVESQTHGGSRVTGVRIGPASPVTGDTRGTEKAVSGTQYIGADGGAGWRAGAPKVGQARTSGGQIVSGSLVRSSVHVTGDEAGNGITITGEADGSIGDDLTRRSGDGAPTAAQFARQSNPHGNSVFGTNLGRSARTVGSRERVRSLAIEQTESGLPVTGSAVGRSLRVTGDRAGACRTVTGDQYLAPARRQAECGGAAPDGGTTPAKRAYAGRPDPVTGAKVAVGQTWSGKRVTGIDVEHDPRVTGAAAGTCAAITGSPYQGPDSTYRWCDDGPVDAVETRLRVRPSAINVSGDTPVDASFVTGTSRGAARAITGTPYYREPVPEPALPAAPVAAIDERFSVSSPQRSAQLRAGRVPQPSENGRITGSFAVGQGKITGNLEFTHRPRSANDPGAVAARLRITGEGRPNGRTVTGGAWNEQANVGGTEGAIASDRNPSERGPKRKVFAGSNRFKELASHEEPKHLVTGMFGYSSDSAAKVTLSGGAQG